LLYQSESDEPFEVLHWNDAGDICDPQKVLALSKCKTGTLVKMMPVEEFFKDLVEEKSWHGEDEKEDVRKYRILKEIIGKHLMKPQVFRVGQMEVVIWIIGKAGKDDWFGIRTKAIET
jgi:hypothetical protein